MPGGDGRFPAILFRESIADGALVYEGADGIGHPVEKWLDGRAAERQHGIFGNTGICGAHCIGRSVHESFYWRENKSVFPERPFHEAKLTKEDVLVVCGDGVLLNCWLLWISNVDANSLSGFPGAATTYSGAYPPSLRRPKSSVTN